MPMLDVRVALTNPYTLDTFSVSRRQETVNSFGESTQAPTLFNGINGVVYPEGDENLDRRDAPQLQAKTIVVITRFALRGASVDGAGASWQPDVIVWSGSNYVVDRVEDYSRYAAGFIKVSASLLDSTAPPPTTTS